MNFPVIFLRLMALAFKAVPTPFSALQALRNERGITYLMVMIAIVLMGVSLTVVGQHWSAVVKRDREAELLFRGGRIKRAIEAYAADYEVRKGARPNQYPLRLDQLTEGSKRYLATLYRDPFTGQEFDLIVINGEIRGVKSRSTEVPLDKVHFKDAASYNQIAFQAIPPSPPGEACTPQTSSVNFLNSLAPNGCPPSNQIETPSQ
jgi:type II secretory pathway pseudopilin PulG